MSDGEGSRNLGTVLPCSPPVTFQAFAVGKGSSAPSAAAASASATWRPSAGAPAPTCPTVDLPDILPEIIGGPGS